MLNFKAARGAVRPAFDISNNSEPWHECSVEWKKEKCRGNGCQSISLLMFALAVLLKKVEKFKGVLATVACDSICARTEQRCANKINVCKSFMVLTQQRTAFKFSWTDGHACHSSLDVSEFDLAKTIVARKSVLFRDGAKAWRKAANDACVPFASVNRSSWELCRQVQG